MNKNRFLYLSTILLSLIRATPIDAEVLSNDNITVSVGNEQSWTGRNGTGNLSYYGCDRNGNCIYLTGGKITCRKGICNTVWQHKNFTYVLASPITEVNVGVRIPSTLTISSDSKLVTTAELYPKPFDNLESTINK